MSRILCAVLVGALLVVADQEEAEGGKCERIKLPLCQDLGYNWTAMPNLLGHKDQKEAEEAMASFEDILSSGCSVHARFLLCSAYAPLCSEEVSGAVSACRDVCETVVAECRERLPSLPSLPLDCSAFPLRPDRRLCMRPPNATDAEPDPPPPERWPFREHEARAPACPPAHERAPGGECRPLCDPRPSQESRAAETWTSALAGLALLSTSFALVTFCAEPGRYRYPERPGVWAAACHALVALAYLARGWLGGGSCASAGATLPTDGLASPTCVAFFSTTYYFTLAGDAWFASACAAWYLTAASEWSTEALERAAAYLHAGAWGWAGAWTAAALALRRVAGDGAGGGACGVSDAGAAALVGVPRGSLLLAAAALGAGAGPGVVRVRRALESRGARRVGRLAARAAAAALLYVSVAGAATGARLWEARHAAGGGGGAVSACLCLAGGVAAGAWAWSRKSAAVWRRALCPPRKAPCATAPPLLRPHHPYYKRPLHVSRV